MIFKTTDSFELKLVFMDVGGALIYSEKDSDIRGFTDLLPDGISFQGSYQLYAASYCSKWFDINNDKKHEFIAVNIGNNGTLWYVVHVQGVTLANNTIPFTKYDDVKFEDKDGSLYLVCEYSEIDFNSYRYKVSFDGENLIFTPEE